MKTKDRKATTIRIPAVPHVQYSCDVLLHTGLARRLARATRGEAVAAARLFINALHPQLPTRATVAEAETVLALVLERIKESRRLGRVTPCPVDIKAALDLADKTGALEDIWYEQDHFEQILSAMGYLRAYCLVINWDGPATVTLEDGARFVGFMRTGKR